MSLCHDSCFFERGVDGGIISSSRWYSSQSIEGFIAPTPLRIRTAKNLPFSKAKKPAQMGTALLGEQKLMVYLPYTVITAGLTNK